MARYLRLLTLTSGAAVLALKLRIVMPLEAATLTSRGLTTDLIIKAAFLKIHPTL